MNTPHTIEITITPDGKVHGEVAGVAGPSCASLSAWLDVLGAIEDDRQTPDYRRQPAQTVRLTR
jgi:hypothetical protein